ncbi:MAG: nitrile hydratase subunit alpha [Reyranella sp.]
MWLIEPAAIDNEKGAYGRNVPVQWPRRLRGTRHQLLRRAQLIVLENTAKVHNLIGCTLCSCYPRPCRGGPMEPMTTTRSG